MMKDSYFVRCDKSNYIKKYIYPGHFSFYKRKTKNSK